MLDITQRPSLQFDSDWSRWLRDDAEERMRRMELRTYAHSRARQLAQEIRTKQLQLDSQRINEGEWPVISKPTGLASALGVVIDQYL